MSDLLLNQLLANLTESKRRLGLTLGTARQLSDRVGLLEGLLAKVKIDQGYTSLDSDLRAEIDAAVTDSPVNWQRDPDIDWTGIEWAPGSLR